MVKPLLTRLLFYTTSKSSIWLNGCKTENLVSFFLEMYFVTTHIFYAERIRRNWYRLKVSLAGNLRPEFIIFYLHGNGDSYAIQVKHYISLSLLATPSSAYCLSLAAAGKVQSFGRARARRWMTPPVPGFATTLFLPAPLSID